MDRVLWDGVLPEIEDWDILLQLVKSNKSPSAVRTLLRKADRLAYKLDMGSLNESPLIQLANLFSELDLKKYLAYAETPFLEMYCGYIY